MIFYRSICKLCARRKIMFLQITCRNGGFEICSLQEAIRAHLTMMVFLPSTTPPVIQLCWYPRQTPRCVACEALPWPAVALGRVEWLSQCQVSSRAGKPFAVLASSNMSYVVSGFKPGTPHNHCSLTTISHIDIRLFPN